ncbi:heme ABC transporter ATP-binding protein [Halopiger xanaduensis]|uniref:Cobalamin import ATP-binding protein BtuD n=1 Tax=Halopiger xanaduensis (strain DSM 18323 / JCM 14033 / SH-6) TaxID=797210 RepID=F8D863_HALXS|nr:heme ABC transporter ATP-binding protein [Halopiger xanaduensis]AEH37960.1 Iron-chelate-transporting ATPase [Halopiger xanaduensis SH-6]
MNRTDPDAERELSPLKPATVVVENVSHAFGDLQVLEDVSLTVDPGEFVGLVGPNGAGKTTLLRTISGALEPDSGTVEIDGTDVHDVSSRASSRLVAVVPQDTTLSFSFDVRDVVEMGRHPHRSRFVPPRPEDQAVVERALERTRTSEFADRPIDEVSGGQRQRVVLARAIAQATPALLLDEPTASLDVNHQVETLELVRELVSEGRTAVAAIHDLDLAARYCDRLVLLSEGTIAREGAPSEVLTSDALADAFDATAVVTENPITATPTVTTVADRDGGHRSLPERVHVLGTGTAATGVLARLEAAGIDASVGPIPSGGAVAETARRLGADPLVTEPFSALSADDRDDLERAVDASEVTVLADLSIGTGNRAVLEVLEGCERLVAVETTPVSERHFVDPAALERYESCRERAAAATVRRVIDAVESVTDRDAEAPPSSEIR